MSFRQTEVYKSKLMRIGKALRRFGDVSGSENNFNSLAREIDVLEELSLSTFSLMKAIKKELSQCGGEGDSCIIRPFTISSDDGDS